MTARRRTLACLACLLALAVPAFAGGPLIIFDPATQTPYAYPGPVDVYTDLGSMGPLTNAQADVLTANGYGQWTGVATSSFSAAVAGDFTLVGLPDITGGNAGLVVGADNGGGIHVMYDDDGTITSNFFGAPPGVLGIASPDFAVAGTNQITESWTVLNGAAVDPADIAPIPGASFGGVFAHEFGHTINLAHSQTNGDVLFFGNNSAPAGCPGPGGITFDDTETMYPFLDPSAGSVGINQSSVDRLDDIAALSNVYPAVGWPDPARRVSGTIYAGDGITEVTGVNVVARNAADPFGDCISALSGDFTQGLLGPDGRYTFNGLTPGADYVVYINQIVAGGFSTPPRVPLGAPQEYYNGAGESTDPATDDPCQATTVQGGTSGVDIAFNDDGSLDLGDDDFEEVALPFPFTFCGTEWNSVYVGSNGFVTFGAGDTDFSESVGELRSGPPRIAVLWVDLSPNFGGSIFAEEAGGNFEIRWENVTEFLPGINGTPNSNNMTLTLRPDGTFSIEYGQLDAVDGIVGTSHGNGIPGDPGEIDVSTAPQPISGTPGELLYEQFIGDQDVAYGYYDWEACPEYEVEIATAVPGTCYGSLGAGGGGLLITVDPSTGAGTEIGPTGLGGMPGLAVNSAGEIFGTDRVSGDLYRVDALTGQAYFVAATGVSFLDGIAFDENDVLYGVAFNPPYFHLITIDTENGDVTPIGPTGDVYVGLAFDDVDGTLYASVGGFNPLLPDHIAVIDKSTGAATVLGQTGLSNGAVPDVKVVDGVLYASKNLSGGQGHLVEIDKSTGAGTVVGNTGFNSLSGLTYYAGCTDGPELAIELSRDVLWPPNHEMVEVCATVTVTDDCDTGLDWQIVDITSNEAVNGQGDGNTDPDWVFDPEDGCFQLRAERSGGGNGRKYTITFEATDSDGNTTQATACVEVPHDRRGNAVIAGGVSGGTVEPGAVLVTLVVPGSEAQRAEDLDPDRVYLGHQGGVIRPLGSSILERTGDGFRDLIFLFNANQVRILEQEMPQGSGGKIGLHYSTADGRTHYMVKNVLGAGEIELIAGRDGNAGGEQSEVGDGETPDPTNSLKEGEIMQEMTVEVFTVTGRLIRTFPRVGTLDDAKLGWDGRDAAGRQAPSGVYFYRITTPERRYIRKIMRVN